MADDIIPQQVITLTAIIGTLICIYLSSLNIIGGILSMAGVILSVVYGTNTLRHIGKYSLGTGVPSICYMLTAVGLVSLVSSILLVADFNLNQLLLPIIALVLTVFLSLLISMVCKYVFKLEIDILTRSFISISVASMLMILSVITLMLSSFDAILIYDNVLSNGLIILVMIIVVMSIQSAYNGCIGPNEEQFRTLSLSISTTFLMLIVISVISMLFNSYWYIYTIISIIGLVISLNKFFKYSYQQAASVKWSGLWSNNDKEEY